MPEGGGRRAEGGGRRAVKREAGSWSFGGPEEREGQSGSLIFGGSQGEGRKIRAESGKREAERRGKWAQGGRDFGEQRSCCEVRESGVVLALDNRPGRLRVATAFFWRCGLARGKTHSTLWSGWREQVVADVVADGGTEGVGGAAPASSLEAGGVGAGVVLILAAKGGGEVYEVYFYGQSEFFKDGCD